MCQAVEDYGNERKGLEQGEIKAKLEMVDRLLADGFELSKALKLADIDEAAYNKYKSEAPQA